MLHEDEEKRRCVELEKPNIVMIMADQMTTNAIGVYGNAGAKTPNLDRLAEDGIVFRNCYCNSPLCAPARASLVTGLRISRNHVFDNGAELSASIPTFMHHLRRAGYRTVASGKLHFIGPDQLHGFERRLTTDIYPASFAWTPDWRKGAYPNLGSSVRTLEVSGACKWNIQLNYDEEVHFRALEFLRYEALEADDKPFFLCISYTHPHEPFMITDEYWKQYQDGKIDFPKTPPIPFEKHHPYNQWIQIHHEIDKYPPSEDILIRSRRAYHGMVSYVDKIVGDLMNELKRLGLLENTLIVFTSDHGEMLGEHGMWFKRTFFDGSTKVPLIISWPGVWPRGIEINKIVSLMDLCPTFIELGNLPEGKSIEKGLDGSSLCPLLAGQHAEWKDEAICEYLGEGTIRPMLMLRKGNFKYIHIEDYDPILFDMNKDPYELCNLAGQTDMRNIEEEMRDTLLIGWDEVSMRQQVTRSQQARLMINEALKEGQKVSWDYQPFFDASKQYVRNINMPHFI